MSYLCFDIGGTFVKYGLFSQEGKSILKNKFPTIHESTESFIQSLVEKFDELNIENNIQGIGLSFPGFINVETGEAIMAGALDHLHGQNVIELLQKQIGAVNIVIENDANCAALAEQFGGHAQETDSLILMTLGTGIGGAIVENRQILHGHAFQSGEFGMMTVDYSQRGYQTLHELASTSALVRRYQEHYQLSLESITGEAIFADKRPETQEILEKWANYVALAIFNVVCTLNPQKLLLGGGVSQNDQLLPLIETALQRHPHWKDFSVPIEACYYYNDAGLIGALTLLLQQKESIK